MVKALFVADLVVCVVLVAVGVHYIVYPASAIAFFFAGVFFVDAVWGMAFNAYRQRMAVAVAPAEEE